jgi:hypothetical protein
MKNRMKKVLGVLSAPYRKPAATLAVPKQTILPTAAANSNPHFRRNLR